MFQQYRDKDGSPKFIEAVHKIPVHTVDRFQGDENEHIVLSLVRWNKDNRLGFSAIPNRICVALSRAQCGLFVVGQVWVRRVRVRD
jgi:superfamily I DNA and/or RNA helicase